MLSIVDNVLQSEVGPLLCSGTARCSQYESRISRDRLSPAWNWLIRWYRWRDVTVALRLLVPWRVRVIKWLRSAAGTVISTNT